jgi:3-phenylpropionate/trans-cinnamate dioxygenase ferredoxin reductase subunit
MPSAPAIVIAGAGECGTRAAFALRVVGWDGRVILAGTEPSPPYERPPLSRAARPRIPPRWPIPPSGSSPCSARPLSRDAAGRSIR